MTTNTEHTSKQFDAELEQIRREVLEMGRLVERQLVRAAEGLRRNDGPLMDEVIQGEVQVNAKEILIDELCTMLIARRQPEAGDLRLMMMVLKGITDLERIGDEAKKIALTAREIAAPSGRYAGKPVPRIAEISNLAEMALGMLRTALDMFATLDISQATEVARRDLELDQRFRSTLRELLTYMMEDPRTISASLDILFVAKSLERIGDHAKNITEYMVYLVKGKDVRHVTLEEFERVAQS